MPNVDSFEFDAGDAVIVESLTDADWHDDQTWTIAMFFYDATWGSSGNNYAFALSRKDGTTTQDQQVAFRNLPADDFRVEQDVFNTLVDATNQNTTDATWYSFTMTNNGSGQITTRVYTESGSFLEQTQATRSAGDFSSLHFVFGCWYNNDTGAYTQHTGEVALVSAWKDTELSVANQNSWAADPLNFGTQPDYIRLFETDGTINESGGTVTNNGSGADATFVASPTVASGGGPNVTALATSVPGIQVIRNIPGVAF